MFDSVTWTRMLERARRIEQLQHNELSKEQEIKLAQELVDTGAVMGLEAGILQRCWVLLESGKLEGMN